jgi:hypothetical protein
MALFPVQSLEFKSGNKEALLVFPGIGYGPSGMKAMKRLHREMPHLDLFVPNYIRKSGISDSVEEVRKYIQRHGLNDYLSVHVFCFIAGGFIFHDLLQSGPPVFSGNLSTLVLDRSPHQERAPRIVTSRIPGVAQLLLGRFVFELAERRYPDYSRSFPKIAPGLVIEKERTTLLRLFAGTSRRMGRIKWDPESMQSSFSDYMYAGYNHDSIYANFDQLAGPLSLFMQHRSFGDGVDRLVPG